MYVVALLHYHSDKFTSRCACLVHIYMYLLQLHNNISLMKSIAPIILMVTVPTI